MSGPWEKYGASPAPEEQGPWARYAAPVPAQAGTRPPVLSFKQLPKKVDAIDRVRAAAAGVNKGFFSDLVGLPVDTMASAIDLAKAGVGFAYNEGRQLATGKQSAPPAWTEPADRSKVVMSSEWIADKLNAGGGRAHAVNGVDLLRQLLERQHRRALRRRIGGAERGRER
jgi:hypothetical protein